MLHTVRRRERGREEKGEDLSELFPFQLCDYLYNLSTTFTEFYSECYVVEKLEGTSKVNMNRLLLAHVTANTMETALNILGIKPVPKM